MFSGRLSRKGYLLGTIYYYASIAVVVLLALTTNRLFGGDGFDAPGNPIVSLLNIFFYLFGGLWVLLAIPINLGLAVRRLHDMDQPGWLSLGFIFPPLGLILFLFLLLRPGTTGINKFGESQTRKDFKSVLFGSRA